MANRSAVFAWSADEYSEEGSGTVLALTIIAALLVVTVVIAGLIGVVSANRRASAAADLSALAAADAYRGLTEGDPCAVAADLAERHGAHLESCTFPDRPETVEVTVAVPVAGPLGMLGPARVRARAGAEYPEEEYAEEEHDAAGNVEELSPDEVAELEEELGIEQDSVPEPPKTRKPSRAGKPTRARKIRRLGYFPSLGVVILARPTSPSMPRTPSAFYASAMLRNIACSSARAPCLLSGSLRLPHLGECTQEGQPLSHPQLSMASRVALSHC